MRSKTVNELIKIIQEQSEIISLQEKVIDRIFGILSLHISEEEFNSIQNMLKGG